MTGGSGRRVVLRRWRPGYVGPAVAQDVSINFGQSNGGTDLTERVI
jgi:hypothetical protein